MKAALSKALLRLAGWKVRVIGDDVPKSVLCIAPHTSNWDFVIGKMSYTAMGRNAHFLIKKDWFFFPFNLFFKWIGGVPVDRKKRTSLTQQMVYEFESRDSFQLAITPEGSRKAVSEWKKGFYHIAVAAKVPITLIYIDYGTKEAGIKEVFYPTGDMEKDLRYIREQYRGKEGRNKEQFIHI